MVTPEILRDPAANELYNRLGGNPNLAIKESDVTFKLSRLENGTGLAEMGLAQTRLKEPQVPQYPTVNDIIESNKVALREGRDRHPHKLVVTKKGLESIIKDAQNREKKGLEYQPPS